LSRDSINNAYPGVSKSDVPFAQDCLGDQFLLSAGEVVRLGAEDGKLDPLGVGLQAFLDAAQSDPLEYLQLHPLVRFMQDGGSLLPGQLLLSYPPFITSESADGNVSLSSVPAEEAISFHQDLARQLRGTPDGAKIEIRIRPPNKA
jgi:hypothetical protein